MVETHEEVEMASQSKQSKARPVFLGCGIGCLAIIVLFIIFSFLVVRWGVKHFKDMTDEFEKRGFIVVRSTTPEETLTITEKVTKPTLFIGQEVHILQGADAEVAMMSAKGSLHGIFTEKVYYRGGGELFLAKDAQLLNGIDAQAKKIDLSGRVQGEITGRIDEMVGTPTTRDSNGTVLSP
jgi:hypothetical protein